MENVRELALDILMEILEKGAYSHLIIREVLDKYNYSDARNRAFVKRLTEGTLERLLQIDFVLDQFSKVPVSKMKPLIRNLLRMSVYQILFMDSIPDRAVCNEAVRLAGKRGFRGLSGFVNGVLRSIARGKDEISYPDEEKEPILALSVNYSMPEWLVSFFVESYGMEKTRQILDGLLKEHLVTVRLKESLKEEEKESWKTALKEQKVEVTPHPYLPYAYRLSHTEGVQSLPGYEQGWFAVQDVSSMLVAEIAAGMLTGRKEEEELLVVDVCAAPGGKSMHMAEKLGNRGRILSRDLTEYKASQIRDNKNRMGYENITVQVWDGTVPDEELALKADVVLADLPCSGLGIMGKKRDIKYRIQRTALEELAALQRKLLLVAAQYVKPGGILIYSTCTMNPGENEEQARWFQAECPFELKDLLPHLPEALRKEQQGGMLQLFPGIHETDGFFIAGFQRKDNK